MLRSLLSRRNLLLGSLCLLILAAMTVVLASKGVLATTLKGDEDDQRKDVFYTTSFSFSTGQGELWAIEVSGRKITTTDIGPMKGLVRLVFFHRRGYHKVNPSKPVIRTKPPSASNRGRRRFQLARAGCRPFA